jgi:hypothetical protein
MGGSIFRTGMRPQVTTRRNVMKGIGIAGIAGITGTSGAVNAATQETTNGDDPVAQDDDQFAAVRVGNLVPDLAMGTEGDSPGKSGQAPGRRGISSSAPTALDVYIGKPADGNPTIGGVQYPAFGPGPGDAYLQVPAREYDVTVAQSGSYDPLLEERFSVGAGNRYTALAVGRMESGTDGTGLQSLIIEDGTGRDDVTAPSGDVAEVSFVHASPNAGPVDIIPEGQRLSELLGLEFGDVTDYLGVPAGEYEIEIQSEGESVLTLTRELVAETRVTVYAIGLAGVSELPSDEGEFGLNIVATVDGLNPLPRHVITR